MLMLLSVCLCVCVSLSLFARPLSLLTHPPLCVCVCPRPCTLLPLFSSTPHTPVRPQYPCNATPCYAASSLSSRLPSSFLVPHPFRSPSFPLLFCSVSVFFLSVSGKCVEACVPTNVSSVVAMGAWSLARVRFVQEAGRAGKGRSVSREMIPPS
ncbi:uncharacterized protein J3D65DRAFT_73825 [Phyllosticta citribraziliensis]|uniref:Secreted protein n=1 Tax=Phyllosticta citribraziliensis TaxID=989973 RepID=A0ABR1LDB2_9PEZI